MESAAHGEFMYAAQVAQAELRRLLTQRLLSRHQCAALMPDQLSRRLFYRDNLVFQIADAAMRDRRRNEQNIILGRLTTAFVVRRAARLPVLALDGIERSATIEALPYGATPEFSDLADLGSWLTRAGLRVNDFCENVRDFESAHRDCALVVHHRIWENRYYLANDAASTAIANIYRHCQDERQHYFVCADVERVALDERVIDEFDRKYVGVLVNQVAAKRVQAALATLRITCQLLPIWIAGHGLELITIPRAEKSKIGVEEALLDRLYGGAVICINDHLRALLDRQNALEGAVSV